jgi:pyrroloquinoline quinone (PQQ) biosynthesis protein C
MNSVWSRTGDLKDLRSYPEWLQAIVEALRPLEGRIAGHELFVQMRDAALRPGAARNFLIRAWPVIEQFPQYMGRNLAKLEFGRPGHDLARSFLTRNIRVERHHAEYWAEWAHAAAVPRGQLLRGSESAASAALSHWCWFVCDRGSLPEAIAATNYAIEGVTGQWAQLICSSEQYAQSLPQACRKSGMRWLRAHARYDDAHPWEALEIVAALLGARPPQSRIEAVRRAVRRSYEYVLLTLQDCLTHFDSEEVQPAGAGARRVDEPARPAQQSLAAAGC